MHFLRKLTPLALCLLFFLGIFNVAHADITSNLLNHFTLDDYAASRVAVDSVSTSTMLPFFNSNQMHVTGKIGTGAFNISGGNVNSFISWSASDSSMTASAWILSTTTSAAQVTFTMGGAGIKILFVSGAIECQVTDSTFTSVTVISTSSAYNNGNWHNAACVVSPSVIGDYVDGVEVASSTNKLNGNYTGFSGTYSFSNGNYYADDLRVYNRALSSADIAEIYAYGSNRTMFTGQWYSYSDDFFVHALPLSLGNATSSFGTSTSFKVAGAANETTVGTSSSSSFQIQTGFLRNAFIGPAPNYKQIHYHWRNDDGSETTATSKTSGVQDTAITNVSKLSTNRLRLEIANKGGTIENYSSQQFQLEYGLKSTTCAAISTWTSVGTGNDWDMVNSSNLTDGNNTTNISTSVGGVSDGNHTFLSTNAGVKDTSSLVSALSVPSDSFAELEFSIEPTSSATDGGDYCFRVTNAGSTSDFTYTQYPEATVASAGGTTLTFVVDSSSETFPSVTPGTLSATTTILSVSTNNSTGFNMSLQRGDSTGTMSLGTTYIPDKTDWVAPSATTTAGNATASTTQPQTLQFRIRKFGTDTANFSSSWWGTDDTTANALFGGIPSTTQKIINRSVVANSTTTAYVQYDLNVPLSQKNGIYSGSITYTVVANP